MSKKHRRQLEAARARKQRATTVGQPVVDDSGLHEYRQWVRTVLEAARLEVGVCDADWEQIGEACAGATRFGLLSLSRPYPEEGPVLARSTVLEEYARWLACERAVAIGDDGSPVCDADVVAVLADLPADTFEENWVQVGQPAQALFTRCCDGFEEEHEIHAITWLTDLHTFGRDNFGECGRRVVAATIDTMLNSEYNLTLIQDDWQSSAVAVAVSGAAKHFDETYGMASAPRPTVADLTDLVTAVAATSAWLDSRAAADR